MMLLIYLKQTHPALQRHQPNFNEIANTNYNQVCCLFKKVEKRCLFSIYAVTPIVVGFSIFYAFVTTREYNKTIESAMYSNKENYQWII